MSASAPFVRLARNKALVLTVAIVCACSVGPPAVTPSRVAVQRMASGLDAVVFLVGDAGHATAASPLMHKLKQDVAAAHRAIDSAPRVLVVFLGDLVYEEGVRKDPADRKSDSTTLRVQAEVVGRTGDAAVFVPGNHDWKQGTDPSRVMRLDTVVAIAADIETATHDWFRVSIPA